MARRVSRRRLLAGSVPLSVGLAGCSVQWGPEDDGDGDGDGNGPGDGPGDGDGPTSGADGDGTGPGDRATTTDSAPSTERPDADLFRYLSISTGDPTYRRWQPGSGDRRGVQDVAHNVAYAREFRSDLPAGTYEDATSLAMFNGYVGVEYAELDGVVVDLSSVAAVYVGTFDRGDVVERLRKTPYQRFETAEGIEYYRWDRSSGTRFVAAGDEGVVAGRGLRDAEDPARAFVEGTVPLFATAAGDQPRLHEESALYERYTDEMGWPLVAWAMTPRPSDGAGGESEANDRLPGGSVVPEDVAASVRVGFGEHVAGDTLVNLHWLWTTEDGPADPETVRAAYDDAQVRAAVTEESPGETADLAVRRDGRVVEVAVLRPVEDVLSPDGEPGGGRDPPLVAVDATVESGTLTLQHFAGDPLPLSLVSVRGAGDPISLGEGELAPGESVAVDVPEDATNLAVVYSPPTGDSNMVVAEA